MARIIYILMALVAVVVSASAENCALQKYCKNPYQPEKLHTLCQYPSMKPSWNCGKVSTYVLDKSEVFEILDAHNEFRALVANGQETRGINGRQPRGKIGPLRWDPELAKVAQRWAMQCEFGHDGCRHEARFHVGQNVASRSSSAGYDTKMKELVQMWYDEVADYDNRQVSKFQGSNGPVIGHYTQLVWGKTTHVGCGAVRYHLDGWYTTYLVCNYGPAGNVYDNPVYETR